MFNRSTNVNLNNVTVQSASGSGVLAQVSKDIIFNGFSNVKPDSTTPMMYDAIHASNCYGNIAVIDSEIQNTSVNGLNVHASPFDIKAIQEVSLNNKISCDFIHPHQRGLDIFDIEDDIRYYNKNTYDTIATQRVTGVNKVSPERFILTLEDDIPIYLSSDCALENISKNPSLIVDNTKFYNIPSHAMVINTCKPCSITNNVLSNITKESILLEGVLSSVDPVAHPDYDYEIGSGPCRNLRILDNTFDNCNGSSQVYVNTGNGYHVDFDNRIYSYHQNIELSGNTFKNYDNMIFNADDVENVDIHHNNYKLSDPPVASDISALSVEFGHGTLNLRMRDGCFEVLDEPHSALPDIHSNTFEHGSANRANMSGFKFNPKIMFGETGHKYIQIHKLSIMTRSNQSLTAKTIKL